MSSEPFKVIIVGAGITGLVLASALRAKGIAFEVYERDSHPDARPQGYAISLRWFIDTLKRNAPSSAPDLDSVNILYNTGVEPSLNVYEDDFSTPILSMKGERAIGMRANRSRLRKWLLTEMDVHWSVKFKDYETLDDGRVKVFFEDGRTTTGSLLVGADGVHSHVRQLLYAKNPKYIAPHLDTIRVAIIGAQAELNAQELQDYFKFATTLALSNTHVKFMVGIVECAQDLSRATAYWVCVWPDDGVLDPNHWVHTGAPAHLLEEAKKKVSHLDPSYTRFMDLSRPDQVFKPNIVLRDLLPQFSPPGPVTLAGDAAHVMAPFRGEGGNNAVEDALLLAEQLSKLPTNLQEAITAYETSMIPRAEASVRTAHKAAFSEGRDFIPSNAPAEFSVKDSSVHAY